MKTNKQTNSEKQTNIKLRHGSYAGEESDKGYLWKLWRVNWSLELKLGIPRESVVLLALSVTQM